MGVNNNNVVAHRSSAERLKDLEVEVTAQGQALTQLGEALNSIGESIKVLIVTVATGKESTTINAADVNNLHRRLEGLTATLVRKAVATAEEIGTFTRENNVEIMVSQLKFLLDQGLLITSEEVTGNSFLIFEEIDKNDKVTNARVQLPITSLPNSDIQKLVGKKAGETLQLAEDGERMRLLEIYEMKPKEESKSEYIPDLNDAMGGEDQ